MRGSSRGEDATGQSISLKERFAQRLNRVAEAGA